MFSESRTRKAKQLRTIARAAADLGKPEIVELVSQIEAARVAQRREEARRVIFRIRADHATRHAEIRQLIAEFQEAHARRREELDELRAEVRSQLSDYAATNKEGREEWRRQLAAIERARRGLEHQEGQDDKTS